MSFTQFCRIDEELPLGSNSLLPPKDRIEYIPVNNDSFPRQKLWNEDDQCLFPSLLEEWRSVPLNNFGKRDFLKLCEQMVPKYKANWSQEPGKWTFTTDDPAMQLRYYLWFLFKYYHKCFDQAIAKQRHINWPWIGIVGYLLDNTSMTCISYNYDFLLERLLSAAYKYEVALPVMKALQKIEESCAPNEVVCLKPHGSILFDTHTFFGKRSHWRSGTMVVDCIAHHFPGEENVSVMHSLEECPSYLDLVLPGHADTHLGNNYSTVRAASKVVIDKADIIIICGLSGAEPDTAEIEYLFKDVQKEQLLIYVNKKRDTNVERMLSPRLGNQFKFIKGSRLDLYKSLVDTIQQSQSTKSGFVV